MTFLRRPARRRDQRPLRLRRPTTPAASWPGSSKKLVPTLRPGDIVILDNLASHKAKAVRQAIRSTGTRLWFLPPYSPDLNPIEQAFAKIKHWMRNAQRRNFEDTWRHLGTSSPPSSPANARTTSETSDAIIPLTQQKAPA